ncbi:MAG: hypothetical protein F6K41_36055 [Symploca sp. SIO3E6]|nr:hypothetical protein [Caldora sp. SIO3E6]
MLGSGLFFFIFDSFDEMPMVLDCDDRSDRLKQISLAFDTFFKDLHKCRGIVSSRPFRQPVGFRSRRLTIRPFQEKQLRTAMKNWLLGEGLDADQLVRRLLVERPHLAPALRNPFMSDLIAQYLIYYRDQLPNSYYDLFDHYINRRFDEDTSYLEELNLTKATVIETAIAIAQTIYNTPDTGLEITVSTLKNTLSEPQLEDKIQAMSYSRIARLGGSSRERFSFVHRRFAEFFAVRALLDNPALVNRNAIPTDSRWRDGLVVYCGVAPEAEVRKLAEFAWQTIEQYTEALVAGEIREARAAIHCLRFLRDAFQSRLESIEYFREALSILIVDLIGGKELLTAKIAAEALPLVTPKARTIGIKKAFSRNISWLSETALRSCRHLAELESQAVDAILWYTQTLPTTAFLKSFSDLDFSLSLSDSLQQVRLIHRSDRIWLLILWILFSTLLVYRAVLTYANNLFFDAVFFFISAFFGEVILCYFKIPNLLQKNNFKITRLPRYMDKITRYRTGFDVSIRALIFFCIFTFLLEKISTFYLFEINFYLNNFIFNWQVAIFAITFTIPSIFWIFIAYLSIDWKLSLSWIKRNQRRFVLIIVTGLSSILFFGSFMWFISWIIAENNWLYWTIIVLMLVYISSQAYFLIHHVYLISRDFRLLKQLNLGNELTWVAVCQTTNRFRSDWGQSRYLEMLRTQKIQVIDLDAIAPSLSLVGVNAEAAMARLKEQIYDLQE